MHQSLDPTRTPVPFQAPQSKESQLVVQVLEMCFCMLPRVQLLDVQVRPIACIVVPVRSWFVWYALTSQSSS